MYDFFEALAANNNRPWFAEHKDEYLAIRAQWIEQMQRLNDIVAQWWPAVAGNDAAASTYRIYRDVRFSADKRPYKTHISTGIGPADARRWGHFGIYVQAGPDLGGENGIWAGIWHPEREALRKLRRAISTNAEEWQQIVSDPELASVYANRWDGDRLKKAPQGYDPADPMIEYLKLKDIGLFAPMTRKQFESPRLVDNLARRIRPAIPLLQFLDYSLRED